MFNILSQYKKGFSNEYQVLWLDRALTVQAKNNPLTWNCLERKPCYALIGINSN